MRLFIGLSLVGLVACTPTDKGDEAGRDTAGLSSVDRDGDGFVESEDCNDEDAAINPGATELCDGVDNDCDGEVDEGVTDAFYQDADGDGFGSPDGAIEGCEQQPGTVPSATDCDDGNPDVHPGANEVCNGVDEDCDGLVDEGLLETWYPDADNDGFGDPALGEERCDRPTDRVLVGTDCDDTTAAAHPGAVEVCDELDNDCDGAVDEGVTQTFFVDQDGDGYGDIGASSEACSQPLGYAAAAGDCDDLEFDVNPGATEWCNRVDDDCDGTVDEADAADAGTWYLDDDGDGYGLSSSSTRSCTTPSGHVAATPSFDCDDTEATTYPGAPETCDGADDDCDGVVDEADAVDAVTWWLDADSDGYGGSSLSLRQCAQPTGYVLSSSDCNDLSAAISPGATETCNDLDDDCDGVADNGLATSTWYRDADSDGYGSAASTTADCNQPSGYVASSTDCDDTDSNIRPGATEVCDGEDNDCDGLTDDDDSPVSGRSTWYRDADLDGYGNGSSSLSACDEPSGYTDDATDCDDSLSAVNPGANETCNGRDDDCDGTVDNGVLGTGAACPAVDCSEVLDDNPLAADGTYYLDNGGSTASTWICDMTTDGGGWTEVGANAAVWGTGYSTAAYNTAGFTWNEVLFAYSSGSTHAHCTYPSDLTGCNNIGFSFAGGTWGAALNWGSSVCGMTVQSYASATTYVGGYDFVISRSSSTSSIRLGTLEGISGCTTSDNYGTAYVDVRVRR